jgi:hypothetical protein
MVQDLSDWGKFGILFFAFLNVPYANPFISMTGKKQGMIDWIPCKTIAFS